MRLDPKLLCQPYGLYIMIRWHAARLYELIGVLPLLIGTFWLILVIYWCSILRPEIAEMQNQHQETQRLLAIALPPIEPEVEAENQKLSATEYQQVKALFVIMEKHRLLAKEGRYQLLTDTSKSTTDLLALEIPLIGEYPDLYSALQELNATLPLRVDSLKISRTKPDNVQLNMLLRVTLMKALP